MTNLPRIRVTETAGLRRFLYPLTAIIQLTDDVDFRKISLQKQSGTAVPLQVEHIAARRSTLVGYPSENYNVHFAVSLAPHETVELSFVEGAPEIVPDRLNVTYKDGDLTNTQQRLRIEIGQKELLRSVIYDGIEHLRSPVRIERSGDSLSPNIWSATADFEATIAASLGISGSYSDGVTGQTKTEITACKSWATVNHRTTNLPPDETITFTLPFAVTNEKIVTDFGTGNGTYAQISAEDGNEIVWRGEQSEAGWSWQLSVNGRLDYVGSLLPHELASRNWLHVIDGDKSIAVAVVSTLEGISALETRITGNGDIITTFHTDGSKREKRRFAVCYHFLNALPPIAAATNPHSILEPPHVEVVH